MPDDVESVEHMAIDCVPELRFSEFSSAWRGSFVPCPDAMGCVIGGCDISPVLCICMKHIKRDGNKASDVFVVCLSEYLYLTWPRPLTYKGQFEKLLSVAKHM